MGASNSKNIIHLLKQGDPKTLEKIYLDNREGFINFSKKDNVEEYDAVDIYQDSILVLRENAINGKIDSLQSNISTYLFAIGKYKIFHNITSKASSLEISVKVSISFLRKSRCHLHSEFLFITE